MHVPRLLRAALFAVAAGPLALLLAQALPDHGRALGANPVAHIEDSLGIDALRLLLVTLTLTPLARLTGEARFIAVRRMLGLFAFSYAALHVLTYLLLDQNLAWTRITEDIAKRPWITLGFLAFLILLALALTSTRRAMRRLGRRWQHLHYGVYAALVLGCWHYYWQVKRDVRAPLVYAALAGVLLAARVVLRMRGTKSAAVRPASSAVLPG